MKTKLRRIPALVLCGAMLLSLCACGGGKGKGLTTKDATTCVQVELDATYKGKFDGFVDFYSNVTTQDARDQYNAQVEYEAEAFLSGMGVPSPEDENISLEPSEMQAKRARDLYKDIYAKADYSIVSSSKQDDGTFAVKVNIKPLDIFSLVNENYEAGFEDFWAKFDAVDTESMSDEEFETWYVNVYAPEYYDTLLDLLESQIPNVGYKDEKSIVIQVQQSEDGGLFISGEDFGNLDWLIIDYTI